MDIISENGDVHSQIWGNGVPLGYTTGGAPSRRHFGRLLYVCYLGLEVRKINEGMTVFPTYPAVLFLPCPSVFPPPLPSSSFPLSLLILCRVGR